MAGQVRCTCHEKLVLTDQVIKLVLCKDELVSALLTGVLPGKELLIILEKWYDKTVRSRK